MPIAALAGPLIGMGSSLAGGFIGSNAAQNAAAAQQAAGQKAINTVDNGANASLSALGNTWLQTQSNVNPYLQTGTAALGNLPSSVLPANGSVSAEQIMALDPGFDFRLQQGQQALERAEAAGGSVGSGGAMKAAARYGQQFAAGEFSQAFNRYLAGNQQRFGQEMSLAGLGQSANQQLIAAGTNYADETSQVNMNAARESSDLQTGIGNAQASGYMGAANAWSGALGGIGKSATGINFGKLFGGGSGGGSAGDGGIFDSNGNYLGE